VNRRDPLLPRPVLVFLAVVVAIGWLATVVSALRDPANSGPLLVVTGLLATVIGASFGIQVGRARNTENRDDDQGDDAS
jgi:nitrate/nitrite transporter NarK